MSADTEVLSLEPTPRSVQHARRWVASCCRARGREDLVEAAESGVSELVTNALLHAPGPISVRVSGTTDHPRVEVHDISPAPPRPVATPPVSADPLDALLSTVGRGLRILATVSVAWGAETRADGKLVWFEPAAAPRFDLSDDDLAGLVQSVGDAPVPSSPEPTTEVELRGVPVADLTRFVAHHRELRRELRLLALAHAAEYPQAERLSELFTDLDRGVGRLLDLPALAEVDPARPEVDLAVAVPLTAPLATTRMVRLLELADEFCDAARLLTLSRSPRERAFARWFLTQVGEQAQGAAPVAWSGWVDEPGTARYSSS